MRGTMAKGAEAVAYPHQQTSVLSRYRLLLAGWAVVLVFGSSALLFANDDAGAAQAAARAASAGAAPTLAHAGRANRKPGHQRCAADGTCE